MSDETDVINNSVKCGAQQGIMGNGIGDYVLM